MTIRLLHDGRLRAAPPARTVRLIARRPGRPRRPGPAHLGRLAARRRPRRSGVLARRRRDLHRRPGTAVGGLRVGAPDACHNPTGGPRYVTGGWGSLVERPERHAPGLGVRIETGAR